MNAVARLALTGLTMVMLSAIAVGLDRLLDFGGVAWLVALVACMLLTSLTDRERFWATDITRKAR